MGVLGLILFGFLIVYWLYESPEVMIIVGIMAVIAIIVYLYNNQNKLAEKAKNSSQLKQREKEKQKAASKANEKKKKAAFYEECVEDGFTDLTNAVHRKKMILIATQMFGMDCNDQNLDKLFNESKSYSEEETPSVQELEEKYAIEDDYKNITYYASKTGRGKREQMLKDKRDIAQSEVDKLERQHKAFDNAIRAKEINSYAMGGAAEGIGGIGAGVAAFIKAEEDNAIAREYNKRVADPLSASHALLTWENQRPFMDVIYECNRELKALPLKLVDADADAIGQLEFTNTKINVTNTGALIVTTDCILKKDVSLGEGIKTVMDGTINGNVYVKGKLITTVKMVLPIYGIGSSKKETLKGIDLHCGMNNVNYEVRFEEDILWLMER